MTHYTQLAIEKVKLSIKGEGVRCDYEITLQQMGQIVAYIGAIKLDEERRERNRRNEKINQRTSQVLPREE
mgnify:CR=1 FL=1